MTDKMPPNQELFDLLHDTTGKVFLQSEMHDIINCVHKNCPDDHAPCAEDVGEIDKDICLLRSMCPDFAEKSLETLIRAAQSAGKVEVVTVEDASQGYANYVYTHHVTADLNVHSAIAQDALHYFRKAYPRGLIIKPDAENGST